MSDSPAPFELRKFLLAVGEHGLGMDYVERLSPDLFERYWFIAERLGRYGGEEGKKRYQQEQAHKIVDQLEAGEQPEEVIDPSKMTPEELQSWADSWYVKHYNQET